MLNISVDPADPAPQSIPEDLSVNDQESILELIIEQLLGYEDAIQEFDDHDTQDHTKKVPLKIDLTAPQTIDSDPATIAVIKDKLLFPDCKAHTLTGFQRLDSPPPNS